MTTNHKPSEPLIELADRLYGSGVQTTLGARDVLVWYGHNGVTIAFKGDALRMERACFGEVTERRRSGGSETHFETPGNTLRIRDMLARSLDLDGNEIHGLESNYEHITDVGSAIENAARSFLELRGLEDEVFFTLMPSEGEPWNQGEKFTYYYSSAKRKMLQGKAPENLFEVVVDDVEHVAADICAIVPTYQAQRGALVGLTQNGEHIFASHNFSADGRELETAKKIRDCGGLIFPSLALGSIAANTFGTVTLVSYLDFILSSMRPYKTKKGAWQVTVYDTDAWTGRTDLFVTESAASLFDQMTGNWAIPSYTYELHFWMLGPKITQGPAEAKTIPDTKRMQSVVKRRMKAWNRNATQDDITKAKNRDEKNRYPYLEAKVNGVYSLSSFPLAVVEEEKLQESKKFLRAMGWSGDMIPVPGPDDGLSGLLAYSWSVHDAVVEYAARKNSIERILT